MYLGDDQACGITGKGDVKIQLNGSVWKLDNVKHVPDLRKNLISIGQLALDGYVTTFTGDKWKISKGAMTIAQGTKNGLFTQLPMGVVWPQWPKVKRIQICGTKSLGT